MPNELSPGNPNTRRYTPEEKAQAVRLVRQLRKELGTSQGTIRRVAEQLGYGAEEGPYHQPRIINSPGILDSPRCLSHS